MQTDLLLLVNVLKLLAEIALLALAGQWVLGLLAGAQRDRNLFYQIFQIVTRPVVTGVRKITPRVVVDQRSGTIILGDDVRISRVAVT